MNIVAHNHHYNELLSAKNSYCVIFVVLFDDKKQNNFSVGEI